MRQAVFAGAIAALLIPAAAVQAQNATTLPEGPSSLQETYRDWRVVCVQQEGQRRCAVSQQLTRQDGRRILALELSLGDGRETATGTLVLPFGLALDEGVTLTIDETPLGERLRFRTCLPAGCVVPLTLDAPALTQLRTGKALNLGVAASDTGKAVDFTISLDGFDPAFVRLMGLAASP